MISELNTTSLEEKCQLLLKKQNDLLSNIQATSSEYDNIQKEIHTTQMEYQKLQEQKKELSAVVQDLSAQLEQKQTELHFLEKDIQIAKLSHKSELESLERDRKLDALLEEYLTCDDFCTQFLKNLGSKVVKRDLAGKPIEYKNVYDVFLEARERARKRATSTINRYRRLPDVGTASSGGGVETGGRRPQVPEGMSL